MTDKDTPPTLEINTEKTSLDMDRKVMKEDIPLSPPPVSMNMVTFIAILLCTCVTLLVTIGGSKIWLPFIYPELKNIHQIPQQIAVLQTSLQVMQKSLKDENYSQRMTQLKTEMENFQTIVRSELADMK
ncbi:MAG: hypothetical protein Q8K36_05490, partial [Alphaproteobacteria bacterium]|nr:hypothetical protein [Alphaproteobacteria bacterium]